jgi:saposin
MFGHINIKKIFHGVMFYLQPAVKNVEVIHESDIGVVKPQEDLPCELCEQLVIHLRDILVANTTEEEFEEVLRGLCKQTGSFKDEVSTLSTKIFHEK